MKRVAVIGSAGAGKSIFSRRLGEISRLPVVHLDLHFWNPGWVETPSEEWATKVADLASAERWIIDGNYSRTMDIRLAAADTIIFLDFPRRTCVWRVLVRSALGKPRPDLPEGCNERLDLDFLKFLQWVWNFPKRSRPGVVQRLEVLPREKKVIRLVSPRESEQFLSTLFR